MNLLRDVILPVTPIASCSHIADAVYLADAGFSKVVFTGRVVDSESQKRLRCLAERTQIVAVIDHFRHAELLSQSIVESAAEIHILIEVDIGRQSSGVKPGSDTTLLAAAASRLPALKVIGVFAAAMESRAVRVVNHAARSLPDAIADRPETFVAVSSENETSTGEGQIHCVIASPFFRSDDCSHTTAMKSPVCITATVISRPALEWCVIDVGRIAIGDPVGLRVGSPSGASILHVMPETCTLQLSDEANDLRIGDMIQLTVANPEHLLNRAWIG